MSQERSSTTPRRSRLKPKQYVLASYPRAYCYEWSGPAYCIYPGDVKIVRGKRQPYINNNTLNVSDPTPRKAWATAARRIRYG